MNVFYSTYNKKKPDLRNRMFIVFLKLFLVLDMNMILNFALLFPCFLSIINLYS